MTTETAKTPHLRLWTCDNCGHIWADQGYVGHERERAVICPIDACGGGMPRGPVKTLALERLRDLDEVKDLADRAEALRGTFGGLVP